MSRFSEGLAKEHVRLGKEIFAISELSEDQWKTLLVTQKASPGSCFVAQRLVPRSRYTAIEARLYDLLRSLGAEFKRQHYERPYRLDAYLPVERLDIETDGDYWHSLPGAAEHDHLRDTYLRSRGYRVLRISETRMSTLTARELVVLIEGACANADCP